MPDPRKDPPQTICGFHRPDKTAVPEADLRAAIAAAAVAERGRWFVSSTSTFQREDHAARFGDLVRYWLGGANSTIRPGKLEALQQAAVSGGVAYGNLTDASLNAGISAFKPAEAQVNAASAAVYRASDAADVAKLTLDPAASTVKAATAAFGVAGDRLKQAAAAHKADDNATTSGTLAQARQALSDAQAALDAARKAQEDARRRHVAAIQAIAAARRDHKKAVDTRKPFTAPAQNWTVRNRLTVRQALTTAAASNDTQNVDGLVDNALQLAHQSRADIEAWSAVFVSSCIRGAAIGLKLETASGRAHEGADRLFKGSQRHADYTIEARDRRKRAAKGAYHAFEPRERAVQLADIIVTDRNDFIARPTSLGSLGRTILHGDIVTRIHSVGGVPSYAEAIGGNVAHAVRRRRYPLDKDGKLVVSPTRLYAQEDDAGAFGGFPTAARIPSMLAPASTGRIMALLSPVVECKAVAVPKGADKSGSAGSREFEFESPFVNEEVLVAPASDAVAATLHRLAAESPFGW